MASEEGGLLSIVVPVYRSAGYLADTVQELLAAFGPRGPLELVLVNDGSPDEVQGVIESLAAADPRVRYLELGANRGQHAAVLRGFEVVRGEWVVTVDDDGQNPPEAVERVLEALRASDDDAVYGRFRSTEQTAFRVLASRLNRTLSAVTFGNTRGIAVSNVRALRGDLARALGRAAPGHPYIEALVFRATRRISEVEVPHRPRRAGDSTYRLSTLVRLWVSHLTTLTALPLQISGWGSFLVAALATLVGVVQLVKVLSERRAPAGWLSLFCAVTFLFAVLFAFLGVISTYLARMYVTQNERGLDWIRSRSGRQEGGEG
ncbi:MAG TPA: glycosyltransferase [Myxococcaceae bacterium]|nr:glycosyltransferase [Myxococcaceae bacterium]